MREALRLSVGFVLVSASVGCDKAEQSKANQSESKQSEQEEATSPSSTASAMAPEIANAVQQAAAQAKSSTGSAEGAPPPDGILGLERANQEAPMGSPPKLTLGGNGSEPRVVLGGPLPTSGGKGQIEITVRTGPQAAMPTVLFGLDVGRSEAKSEDPLDAADEDLTFSVQQVSLSPSQLGQLPKEAQAAIQKLKQSKVVFGLDAGAPVGSPRILRTKGSLEDLELMMMGTADGLRSALVSYPKEPVGKDAVWMVTSREVFLGADVVAYRLHRIVEVGQDAVVVKVDTKRYLATPKLGLPGVGSHPIEQFQGSDEATLRIVPGVALPAEGEIVQRLGAVAQADGDPGRAMQVKMELRSQVTFPPSTAPAQGVGKTQPAPAPAAP